MFRRAVLLFAILFFASACSNPLATNDGATIRTQLIRLPGELPMSPSFDPGVSLESGNMPGPAWSSAIEIESFSAPIRAVYLEGPEDAFSMIYECDADSNDGCLVDLAGPALQDLLSASPVSARAGRYDEVVVSTCENEGGYTAYVSGSVSLQGQSYVTKSVGVLGTGGAAEGVAIEYSGCARSYPIPEPLIVSDSAGQEIAFKLYFDIRDIAWASLGGADTQNGWIPGGCAGPMPDGQSDDPYLCAGYPDVAGLVDDTPPELERYRVNGGATIGLIFQAGTDQFIGGYTRRYFEDGSPASPGFTADTPVELFTANEDQTYTLKTFGGSGEGGGPVGHYLTIESFVRDTHDGVAWDYSGNAFEYVILRLQ